MNHYSQPTRFNVEQWLKSIDIWDERYDYVMHNEHWLTSKWEPDCEKCRASGKRPQPLKTASTNNIAVTPTPINGTNASVITTSTVHATLEKTKPTHTMAPANNNIAFDKIEKLTPAKTITEAPPKPALTSTESTATTRIATNAAPSDTTYGMATNNITSSPVRSRLSMNSTNNDPTLKNDRTTDQPNNMDISPQPAAPPPVTIAMTPIAPANLSKRNFVTPYTNHKIGGTVGNETYQRSTRQTTRRMAANQTANDLIDLNETFDLYRSALADTPQLAASCQTPGRHQQLLPDPIQEQQEKQPQQQNYQLSQQHYQLPQQQPQQQAGCSSRIPKIPVRLSSAFGFGSNH